MKVMWLHNFPLTVAGSGNFMFILAKAMEKQGVSIDMRCLGNLRNIFNVLTVYRKLRKEVIKGKYDIIHVQFGSLCGYISSKLPGKKIISLRGSDWYGASSGNLMARIHGFLQKFFTRKSLNSYDGVIVMSKRMQNDINKFYNVPKNKLVVIPDGLDLEIFKPMDRKYARQVLGCGGDDSIWVLFPSLTSNNPVKRYWLAEAGFKEAKKKIPNLKLQLASGIKHEKMLYMINASNVVLMTSTHEGWPNSIKECLACNVPFVCTDVSDLKSISEQTTSCAVVSEDPKEIGAAIVKVVLQDRPNNLHKFVEKMNVDTIVQEIAKFYELVVSNE